MNPFRLLCMAALAMAGSLTIASGETARLVENLFDSTMVGEQTGWVTGAFGVIYHTGDGGRTWQAQETDTHDDLFSIDFTSDQSGVAVGKAGTVLATQDGGKTWVKRPSGTERNLFSVRFSSPKHVWAVGDWGAVIESLDGGQTWKDRSLPDDVVLTSQSWADEQNGVLAGEFGTVRITRDGGQTWQPSDIGTDKTIFGVAFRNPREGWVVGIDGLVMRTKDGGATWQLQRGKLVTQSLHELGLLEALRNPALYDVAFAEQHGYIVGDLGTMLVSADGGETWTVRKLPEEMSLYWLRGVSAAAGNRALVAGANGLTVRIDGQEIQHRKGAS